MKRFLLAPILILALITTMTHAALKVSNSTPGMQAGEPWASISNAFVNASDGDTLFVYNDADPTQPAIDTTPVYADGTITTVNGVDIMPSPAQTGAVILQGDGAVDGISLVCRVNGTVSRFGVQQNRSCERPS